MRESSEAVGSNRVVQDVCRSQETVVFEQLQGTRVTRRTIGKFVVTDKCVPSVAPDVRYRQ